MWEVFGIIQQILLEQWANRKQSLMRLKFANFAETDIFDSNLFWNQPRDNKCGDFKSERILDFKTNIRVTVNQNYPYMMKVNLMAQSLYKKEPITETQYSYIAFGAWRRTFKAGQMPSLTGKGQL